uniref:Uncharacterized protein n=1 Tax=Anguilla anguilla TaxID=7936 RepID=A0A0E9TNB2_ANGAN
MAATNDPGSYNVLYSSICIGWLAA